MALDPVLLDWLNLGIRWLHVIAVIAWIGSSFYFIHLDASLTNPGGLPVGVYGETWQVHGGGFYRMQKYTVAPPELPEHLTWFKWEAYTSFLSGFALLIALYYTNPDLYLIDPDVLALSPTGAIAISIGSILLGIVVYEVLCRSPLGRNDTLLAIVGSLAIVLGAWVLTHIFSGRGAFIHVGLIVGTIMVASVAHVIIPNQRKVVKSLLAHETPDPKLGPQARQRSLHNNYLTLPVLFFMLSGHYPLTFASRWNWVIVALVLITAFPIRYFFNQRHRGNPTPWWTWAVTAAGFVAMVWISVASPATDTAAAQPVQFAQVEEVVVSRCSMCHAAEPVWEGIVAPPKGVMLDTPEHIRAHMGHIGNQAVLTHAMPPGNLTEISPEERAVLAAWIDGRVVE
ncbi:MAG: urate hydroxylase PuuD [Geminicoccaceae bacterium]